MTPERYALVRALYDAVIDLPAALRSQALREQAATHSNPDELISAVMGLVDAAESPTFSHISRPMQTMIGSLNLPTVTAGDLFGAWRVLRPLGEGGMGSVWLVERSDASFTQTAALKFVKGMLREETLNYFTRERQLLAKLNHPNIARLIDGGATKDGYPYLVMEYVDGMAIDQFCRAGHNGPLDEKALLQLFTGICDAIAFAHRQLVVHCDLKPSNILVNAEGRPILLDFGIARLLEVGDAEVTLPAGIANDPAKRSASGARASIPPSPASSSSPAFTPRYASPEQLAAGVVSTASDIYSLGVMFRELLIADGRSVLPSDLNAILKKAAARDPDQRYSTVEALRADLLRYQSQEPVAAVAATPAYVAAKFLRRRWPLVVAGAAFVVTVAGFTWRLVEESARARRAEVAAVGARDNATRERDRAVAAESKALADRDATKAAEAATARERDRATEAERVASQERNLAVQAAGKAKSERDRATAAEAAALQTSDFLVSVFDAADPNASASDVPASTLLTRAEARIEQDINRSPQTQAELYAVMGKVRHNMGSPNQAQKDYQRAIEIERQQNRPLVLAQMLVDAARLDLDLFGGREALKLAREALQLREKHAAQDSEAVADSRAVLGKVLLFSQADLKASAELIQRALVTRQRIDPANAATAESLMIAAQLAAKQFDYPRAILMFKECLTIRERLYGRNHPKVLVVLADLATAYRLGNQLDEAEAAYREVLTIRQKLYGRDNEITLRAIVQLASTLAARENYRESVRLNEEGLAIAEKVVGRDSLPYAVILNNLALQQSSLGLHKIALQNMRQAHALATKFYPATHPTLALSARSLGELLRLGRELEAARAQLVLALDANRKVHGEAHPEFARTLVDLGYAEVDLGLLSEARARIEAVERLPETASKGHIHYLMQLKARIAAAEKHDDEAMRLFLEAERRATTIAAWSRLRSWVFKLPRLEFMATRGIDPAARIATAREVLAKIENNVDPKAEVLNDLRRLVQP